MERELYEMVGDLLNMIDPDGHCENGCGCGECDNCNELDDITTRYHNMPNPPQPEN